MSDKVNSLEFVPVKPGTTDAQVQAFFDHTGPAPYVDGGGPQLQTNYLSAAK